MKVVGTDAAVQEQAEKRLQSAWAFVQRAKVGWRESLFSLWQRCEPGDPHILLMKENKLPQRKEPKWPKAHEVFKQQHGITDKALELSQVKWLQGLLGSNMLTERELDNATLTFAKLRHETGHVS